MSIHIWDLVITMLTMAMYQASVILERLSQGGKFYYSSWPAAIVQHDVLDIRCVLTEIIC